MAEDEVGQEEEAVITINQDEFLIEAKDFFEINKKDIGRVVKGGGESY